MQVFISVLDPRRMLPSLIGAENSLRFLSWALGEESLTILFLHYESLDMREGMVLTIHLSKESFSTTITTIKVFARDLSELVGY